MGQWSQKRYHWGWMNHEAYLSNRGNFAARRKYKMWCKRNAQRHRDRNRQECLAGWWKYELIKQKIHLSGLLGMKKLRSHGQIKWGLEFVHRYFWAPVHAYACNSLHPLLTPLKPHLLFLERSRHHPALRSLLLLFLWPGMLFSQISFWLFLSHPSGLCFYLTSSMRPTLISVFHRATPPP